MTVEEAEKAILKGTEVRVITSAMEPILPRGTIGRLTGYAKGYAKGCVSALRRRKVRVVFVGIEFEILVPGLPCPFRPSGRWWILANEIELIQEVPAPIAASAPSPDFPHRCDRCGGRGYQPSFARFEHESGSCTTKKEIS